MNKERVQQLIDKYNAAIIEAIELQEIEKLIEIGALDIAELKDLKLLEDKLSTLEVPLLSLNMDERFYQMLANEKRNLKQAISWTHFFKWPKLVPRFALASVALLVGIAVGLLINLATEDKKEVKILTQEVSNLKEIVMLNMLEKESAMERLRAVSLTEDMDDVSTKVTNALLQTLNHDLNVNVRLAALDALHPYVTDNHVRVELIRSISKQESPLVQVALAELMAAMQEKSSVKELQKVLSNEKTPQEVKRKIKESIRVLI